MSSLLQSSRITIGSLFPSLSLTLINPIINSKDTSVCTTVINSSDLFKSKKNIIFGLPGAFTPTCSESHLPGYINNYDLLKSKGIDNLYCLSVNDKFVMKSWAIDRKIENKLSMIADGNANVCTTLGLAQDLNKVGFGIRSLRFSMVVDNNVITHLNVEENGKFEVSNAETLLSAL